MFDRDHVRTPDGTSLCLNPDANPLRRSTVRLVLVAAARTPWLTTRPWLAAVAGVTAVIALVVLSPIAAAVAGTLIAVAAAVAFVGFHLADDPDLAVPLPETHLPRILRNGPVRFTAWTQLREAIIRWNTTIDTHPDLASGGADMVMRRLLWQGATARAEINRLIAFRNQRRQRNAGGDLDSRIIGDVDGSIADEETLLASIASTAARLADAAADAAAMRDVAERMGLATPPVNDLNRALLDAADAAQRLSVTSESWRSVVVADPDR